MFKNIFLVTLLLVSFNAYSNENLLTLKQQIERLQREVIDLSQIVYSDSDSNIAINSDSNEAIANFSAIDMRIYDLEKDIKNLTASIEDMLFQIDDLSLKISSYESMFTSLESKIIEVKENNNKDLIQNNDVQNEINEKNTLGSLKISTEVTSSDENNNIDNSQLTKTREEELSPEDQFQSAFDNIRKKNWKEAKSSLINFIDKYPDNQLSGSAHYWLGELYILEKEYRDAALILAEGFQKYPKSIKAPDMLFKLSQSLYNVDKMNESCNTLEKFIIDYPKNKYSKKAKKQIQEYGCLEINE